MANRSSDSIYLKNDRLSVQIALPGTYYKGSRFDWNGFITQVTLDGKHSYCVPESLIEGKGTGGCGLCGEFGIHEPIGYGDAAVGEYFPKIGVGLIRRPDDSAYDFFRSYAVTPVEIEIQESKNAVEFHMNSISCNGYSLSYEKRISIEDSWLKIEYSLKNNGEKAVHTTEYCHNFIGIDNEKVDSSYTLSLPYVPAIENLPAAMECSGDKQLTWKDEGWDKEFYCIIKGYKQVDTYSWELYNRKAKAGVREYDDFEPARFPIWGTGHVISPEVFKEINLNPGETLNWTRKYEFYKD